ncbi:hypothetical protein [Ferrimonas gelatinilytica]|uniref:Uncharacterized protein n=1 Tax=Ferrimonas gelatinilytica TaxID=1255257 RepID=A0ABP9S3J7_9GAMM
MSIKVKCAIAALTTLMLLLLSVDGMDLFVVAINGSLSLYYLALCGTALFDRQWQKETPRKPVKDDWIAIGILTTLGLIGVVAAALCIEPMMASANTQGERIARLSAALLLVLFILSRFAIVLRLIRLQRHHQRHHGS